MTIIFFETKIRFATKINKNQWLSFVFAQMNAACCIGGQNKMRGTIIKNKIIEK